MKNLALALLLLLSLAAQAAGPHYFVTQGGAGSANGSSLANACNGLSDADCQTAPPSGSTIYLCGDFSIGASWNPTTANTLLFNGDCRDFGYPARSTIRNTGGGYNMTYAGSGNITVMNVNFRGSASSTGFDDCVNIDGSGVVTLYRVEITDCKADALDVDNTTAMVYLLNSYIARAGTYGLFSGNVGAPAGVVAMYNKFENNGSRGAGTNHDAIGIGDGTGASEIAWNEIVGQNSETGAGIDIQDSTNPNTVVHYVHNNYIHDCNGTGPGLSSTGSASALFVANIVTNCSNAALPKGVTVGSRQDYYYNAFVQGANSVIKIATSATGAAKSVDLRGNLVIGKGGALISNDVNGSTYTSDYNYFYNGTFKNANTGSGCTSSCDITTWRAGGFDVNSGVGVPPIRGGTDPRSIDDFMLAPGGGMWLAGKAGGGNPKWTDFNGCFFDRFVANVGPFQMCPATPAPTRTTRQ